MPRSSIIRILVFGLFLFSLGTVFAQSPPEHYYNPSENINPDPQYVPGDWPSPDPVKARSLYETKKNELLAGFTPGSPDHFQLLGTGEISFTAVKNEKDTVTGYFRNYSGDVQMGPEGPRLMRMLIDLNSLDTAVLGRNHRMMEFFFKSMEPERGTAIVEFGSFQLNGLSREQLEDGLPHPVQVVGTLTLNGVAEPVSAVLSVQKQEDTWQVTTQEPLLLLLSDFGYGGQIYDLMKSCNHKSLGDQVKVNAELYFR